MTTTEAAYEGLVAAAADASYHTLLELWTKVLEPSERERNTHITPQWSNKIVSAYNDLSFKDMGEFRSRFFDKIKDLADILQAAVEDDDEALKRINAEEDATLNRHHYLTVLFGWQQRILLWELEWDWADPDAAAEMAAISEVHKMFFAEQGLTALLDEIGFQFDDEDREALVQMLEETRNGMEE